MRVLMINDYFGFSAGAFAVAWELSGELLSRGHEVGLLCATQDRAEAGEEEIEGRTVRRLFARTPLRLRPLLTINRPRLIKRAVEWIEGFKPEIVHAHVVHIHLSFGLLRALDQKGWPIILSAHDTGIFCPTKYTCQPPDNPNQPASCSDCLSCQRLRYLPGKASAQVKMVNRHVKENLYLAPWRINREYLPSALDTSSGGSRSLPEGGDPEYIREA